MLRLARTCALLVTVGWATVSLAQTAVKVCDGQVGNRCGGVEKLSDGGYAIDVVIAAGSSGSSGGGLTNTELRATPVPVSASSLPLPTGASTSAAQIDGTQKAITRGGAKGATAAADMTGTAEGADHQAADVQLYSGGTAYKGLVSGDAVDVNDRAARLLGKADMLIGAAAPSVTNYLPSRLSDGAAYYKAAISGDNMGRTWALGGTDVPDLSDRAARKLGQAFLRNPGDTANMGDSSNPVRTDPTGTTTQPVSGTVAVTGVDQNGTARNIATSSGGVVFVYPMAPPLNPFLARCNAVRRLNCQP